MTFDPADPADIDAIVTALVAEHDAREAEYVEVVADLASQCDDLDEVVADRRPQ